MTGVSALFENLSASESTEMEWGSFNGNQSCVISDYETGEIKSYKISLEECLTKVAQTKGGEGINEHLLEKNPTCEIPNFDPLFSAIYSIIPIIFGCSIALKVLKKIFSVD